MEKLTSAPDELYERYFINEKPTVLFINYNGSPVRCSVFGKISGNANQNVILEGPGWLGARDVDLYLSARYMRAFTADSTGEPAAVVIPAVPGIDGPAMVRRVNGSRRKEAAISEVTMADILDVITEELGIITLTDLGISQGGKYSTIFAANHPEKVKALILLGMPSNPSHINDFERYVGQLASSKLIAPITEMFFASIFKAVAKRTKDNELIPADILADIMESIPDAHSKSVVRLLWDLMNHNVVPYFGDVKCPIALADGSSGSLLIHEATKALLELIPENQRIGLREYPNEGHGVIINNPRAVASLVADISINPYIKIDVNGNHIGTLPQPALRV